MSGEKRRVAPQPNVYVPTQPFWDGAREGKLVLQYCKDTNRFQHYPRPVSIYTGSRNLEWRAVSGLGVIYACTTLRISGPGLEGRVPLEVATVELDEQVRLIANIADSDPARIRIGARVKLAWDRIDDTTNYPAFAVI
ncbi:MAG: DNA-binding protein [Rhodopseudomonas sp.]|nr:DNA-binding protein [Rhodopseudomonas sp.]